MINLHRLDLNLLMTLNVLLAEHNVTRAAQRLNLSQPSVSVQLARLREIFNDPLLLPGPRGMQPTARADALREPLREALERLEQAVAPASAFDPQLAANTWRVSATDYMASAILLPAMETLRRQAPNTRLAVFELNPAQIARQAERGDSRSGVPHPRRRAAVAAPAAAVSRALRAGGKGGTSGAAADPHARRVLPA